MDRRLIACFGIALAVVGLPSEAQTPPCGTVVTQSVRFDQDLHCMNLLPALTLGADGVTIDLNGFEILGFGTVTIGPQTRTAPAILSQGFNGLQVIGPGRITNWLFDLRIEGGRRHAITDVTGQSWVGPVLVGASDAWIERNEFRGPIGIYEMPATPGTAALPAFRNQVVGNRLGSANFPRSGVSITGCLAQKNTVKDNEIHGAVTIDDGAGANVVESNRIVYDPLLSGAAVFLGEAFQNAIRFNVIDANGEVGIWIRPTPFPRCSPWGQPGRNGDANLVHGNYIHNGLVGLRLVPQASFAAPMTLGTANVILGNTFLDLSVAGQVYGLETANNDGRNNKYSNVGVEVADSGTGNLWP